MVQLHVLPEATVDAVITLLTPGMNEGAADRGADPDEHGGAAVIDITDVTDGVHDQTGETDQEAVA